MIYYNHRVLLNRLHHLFNDVAYCLNILKIYVEKRLIVLYNMRGLDCAFGSAVYR